MTAKGKLAEIFDALADRPDVMEKLMEHLLGGTSASRLARDLTASGYPIGATTIKDYRIAQREQGVGE